MAAHFEQSGLLAEFEAEREDIGTPTAAPPGSVGFGPFRSFSVPFGPFWSFLVSVPFVVPCAEMSVSATVR
jgi:hypothetical protein